MPSRKDHIVSRITKVTVVVVATTAAKEPTSTTIEPTTEVQQVPTETTEVTRTTVPDGAETTGVTEATNHPKATHVVIVGIHLHTVRVQHKAKSVSAVTR